MKAVVVSGPGRADLAHVPAPQAEDGQVRVRVLACGVCGSDLNAWRGVQGVDYPLGPGLPGHEVWGEVLDGGGAAGFEPGQKVTGLFSGGYAELAVAPVRHVVRLPDSPPLLGEPLACAANAVHRAAVKPGQRVAFVGFGYLAALMAMLMFPKRSGGWTAISRRADAQDLALRLGASEAYGYEEIPATLWDSFDVVVEAAGAQQALDHATWLTAERGRLVIAGYHADGSRTVNMQSWNWKGLDVLNAHERQPEAYLAGLRRGLDIVQRHHLDLATLITHRWPLSRFAEAMEAADAHPAGYIKGAIVSGD